MRPRKETYSKSYSARSALGYANYLTTVAGGGLVLPPGYIFRCGSDGVDIIGLSVSDKASVRSEIWALLFNGSDIAYSDAQRIINIEAYVGLNDYELIGTSTKDYVLYPEGTTRTILNKALRYYGLPPVTGFPFTFPFNLG